MGQSERVYHVQCDGHRHRVTVDRRGRIRFVDHADERDVWYADEREQALAILAGGQATRPLGCYEVAALVRARRYTAPGAKGGARDLLAHLRGKRQGRMRLRVLKLKQSVRALG
jgi:hypothetical protein